MIENIRAHFKEECHDMVAYFEMSKEACLGGMEHESIILRDIAKEEYIHAKHLYDLLLKHGAVGDECIHMMMECNQTYEMHMK